MNQEEKLLQYKEKIERAKVELSQLEGEEKSLLRRLKEEHGLESVKEAKKKLDKLKAEGDEFEEKLEAKLAEIEQKYDFD
uniref:Uncharacterized protein n=1 Tax=viral metagenome TaxID=1070528 RepID=A0A6M3M6N9_9ZZZZ